MTTKTTTVNLAAILAGATRRIVDGQILNLPYPPTVNTYYRNVGGKVLISEKGRKYRKAVANAIILGNSKAMAPGRYAVVITLNRKDKRSFDIDNCSKAILDSLTKAGVWEDDKLVDDLRLIRGPVKKPGGCVVQITLMEAGE